MTDKQRALSKLVVWQHAKRGAQIRGDKVMERYAQNQIKQIKSKLG